VVKCRVLKEKILQITTRNPEMKGRLERPRNNREDNIFKKNVVFWDVALSVNRRVGGMYRLHLQGRKIRER
jgi:hypothetical protein